MLSLIGQIRNMKKEVGERVKSESLVVLGEKSNVIRIQELNQI